MTALGSCKIWILVLDWSRIKSSEPKAGDVTRKIDPLHFKRLSNKSDTIQFFCFDLVKKESWNINRSTV